MPRLSRRAVLIVGCIIGVAVWLLPWLVMGESEPWDGHGPAYPLTLLVIGLGLGFLGPGRPGAAVAGLFAGQFLVRVYQMLSNPGNNETWVISVLLLGGYTFVVAGIGAFLGGTVRQRFFPQAEADRRVGNHRA